jgi:mannose-1-phosphate guanylyltransferase
MVIYGVIMAGGSGTRFWPYSRTNRPKQLLKLFSDESMICETIERLAPIISKENIYISTNPILGKMIKDEAPEVNFVIEPIPKNTAACIALSAITIMERDPEGVMFIETSDHVYKKPEEYIDTIRKAVITARKNKIVLIGIKPTFPHTGLGYIHYGNSFDEDIPDTYYVTEFKEKPDLKTAKIFLEDGKYLWNSGMFIAKCSVMLEEIRKYMPKLHEGIMKIKNSNFDDDVKKEVFEDIESISIDYGVMEKSANKVVINAEIDWDDIGDFLAIERYYPKDERKNVALCEYEGDATNCIMLSQTRKIVANNVDGLIIVDTPDASFVCNKNDMQRIKKAIEKIKEADLQEYLDEYEAENCEVKTDGLIVLLGVSNLEIKRNSKEFLVEGVEQNA